MAFGIVPSLSRRRLRRSLRLDVFRDYWEVAAVSTAPAARQKGYGTAVVCFATTHILEHGRKATILTHDTNVARRKTAECFGFYRSDEHGQAKSDVHQT